MKNVKFRMTAFASVPVLSLETVFKKAKGKRTNPKSEIEIWQDIIT